MAHARPLPAASALVALVAASASCSPGGGSSSFSGSEAIRVEYRQPKDPSHEPLYAEMRERRFLEHLAEALSIVRLPKKLTLVFRGCDGDSNAYYDDIPSTITFCYEYLADIHRAVEEKPPLNVSARDAIDGPTVFVLLHETGHAVFDLLDVPVLGREEDAADYFAALVLLRMGKGTAFHMLEGAAWSYAQEADAPDESDYADIHGLDQQRYYNLLCLAYGSDRPYFAEVATRGGLPKERAVRCADEYRAASHAIQRLVAPSIDSKHLRRALWKHRIKSRWHHRFIAERPNTQPAPRKVIQQSSLASPP